MNPVLMRAKALAFGTEEHTEARDLDFVLRCGELTALVGEQDSGRLVGGAVDGRLFIHGRSPCPGRLAEHAPEPPSQSPAHNRRRSGSACQARRSSLRCTYSRLSAGV